MNNDRSFYKRFLILILAFFAFVVCICAFIFYLFLFYTTFDFFKKFLYLFIPFILISLSLLFILLKEITKLKKSISMLKDFAQAIDNEENIEDKFKFPQNEIESISRHIANVFEKQKINEQLLKVEKDKIFSHLKYSNEGLAVFDKDKNCIIANSLFIQYVNFISELNINTENAFFDVPELKEINDYIINSLNSTVLIGKNKIHDLRIERNSRIFKVNCIIFDDNSFEVSILDRTKLEEENRLKRDLTQNVAHELKTPISSISGYLETIIENKKLTEEKKNLFIQRSFDQCKRLTFLLKDILTLNRMDDAAKILVREEVDVKNVVNQIYKEIGLSLNKKNIIVKININNVKLFGNYSMIYSIFRNLFDNAVAYAGEGIEINVDCYLRDSKYYYFRFTDNGLGVPNEHLNRLFERFYRIDEGRNRKLGGTGLGLAIVKNAVILHGGVISVKNKINGGLEFLFSLKKE